MAVLLKVVIIAAWVTFNLSFSIGEVQSRYKEPTYLRHSGLKQVLPLVEAFAWLVYNVFTSVLLLFPRNTLDTTAGKMIYTVLLGQAWFFWSCRFIQRV